MMNIEEINTKMKSYGYYATKELEYNAFLSLLNFEDKESSVGQDIFAVCLEGPPGAGKTEYAKIYTKLVSEMYEGSVEFIDYQCDATTGKTELFEDINISAAIKGDYENVNIPGKLVDAIKKVNCGKKVILFIDEYDKAREETDAFLLQFLQSGKINSTQHGDLEIKENFKKNLQLIICKNDFRESLSGPLSRRIRIIRLDYMHPNNFYSVARRVLITDRNKAVDEGIINLISLIYNEAYEKRELYNRLPSCSEMLIAAVDADNLIKYANAKKNIVYKSIFQNMFKDEDDINTFDQISKKDNEENKSAIGAVINAMNDEDFEDNKTITDLISENVFKDEHKKMAQLIKEAEERSDNKILEAEKFIEENEEKFKNLSKVKETLENNIGNEKINLSSETIVKRKKIKNNIFLSNVHDESKFMKRSISINDFLMIEGDGNLGDTENWIEIAEKEYEKETAVKFLESMTNKNYGEKVIKNILTYNQKELLTGVVLEDGIVHINRNGLKIISVRVPSKNDGMEKTKIFSNSLVIPVNVLMQIINFLSEIDSKNINIKYNCNIYSENPLNEGTKIATNVYNIAKSYNFEYAELSKGYMEMYDFADNLHAKVYNTDERYVKMVNKDIEKSLECSKKLFNQEEIKKGR